MQLKFTSLAFACALCGFTVQLQAADVKIYGLIDYGMKYDQTNTTQYDYEAHLPEKEKENTYSLNSGLINGSRFGIKGSETIHENLKVYFTLENGFDADTGSLSTDDTLFSRQAIIGLDTQIGQFEFGRTGALVSGNSGGIFANRVSPFGITWQEAQSSQVLSGSVGARVDNGIRYESPAWAGLQFYAQYSNGISGDDAVPSQEKERYVALGSSYKKGPVYLVFVIDRKLNKEAGIDNNSFQGPDYTTFNLGGSYQLDTVKLFAGYQYGDGVPRVGKITSSLKGSQTETENVNIIGYKTHALVFGANIDVGAGTLKVATGYVHGDRDYRKLRKDKNSIQYTYDHSVTGYQFALGYLYPLSKRTDIYAGAAFVHGQEETDRINWGTKGDFLGYAREEKEKDMYSMMMGIRHTF